MILFKTSLLTIIIIIVSITSAFSQEGCDCETGTYIVDTTKVIQDIRERYQYLTSLTDEDFDYIYTKQYDTNECHEPDEITETTHFLNGEVAIQTITTIGSGEGGFYANSKTISYYKYNRLIFEFTTESGESMNNYFDNYLNEYRTYYDNCGKVVRKLKKELTGDLITDDEGLESIMKRTPNIDVTPK